VHAVSTLLEDAAVLGNGRRIEEQMRQRRTRGVTRMDAS